MKIVYSPQECVSSCDDHECPYSHREGWIVYDANGKFIEVFHAEKDAQEFVENYGLPTENKVERFEMNDEWRTIDSAPKDGTPILVWFRGAPVVAEYCAVWHIDNKHWCVRTPSTDEKERSNTVVQLDPPTIDGREIPGVFSGPTHWMPIKPPKCDKVEVS